MLRAARHQTMSRLPRVTWRQTVSSFSTHPSSGRWANQAAFQAPIDTPTTKSGRIPAASRARSIPTCRAPRAPPPDSANAVLSFLQRITDSSLGRGKRCVYGTTANIARRAKEPWVCLAILRMTRALLLTP